MELTFAVRKVSPPRAACLGEAKCAIGRASSIEIKVAIAEAE